MSEFPLSDTGSDRLAIPWPRTDDDLRTRITRLAVLPATAVALLGTAAGTALVAVPSAVTSYAVLGGGAAAVAAVLTVAARQARNTFRAVDHRIDSSQRDDQQWITTLRGTMAEGQDELRRLVKQVRNGEHPTPRAPAGQPADNTPLALLAHDLQQAQRVAEAAVVETAARPFTSDSDHRVAVFVNLARRLQSLIHRAIQKLDELEHQVEDPDLLKGLFYVDHLTTGVRRQAESLAVLGGAVPRRQWSQPVSMYTVLRSAVAEVEHYARVKVVPPIEGMLHGHAVADVIHLIAELVENATTFSAPETQVIVRTENVTAGLAIDIQDRGLGMPQEDQRRANELLANPGDIDLGELLKDGRIGLYVVAELSQRHGVAVRVQNNIYGGTDAVIVVPHRLLGEEVPDEQPAAPEQPPAPPVAEVPAPEPASGGRHEARPRPFADSIPASGAHRPRYERRTGSLPEPQAVVFKDAGTGPADNGTGPARNGARPAGNEARPPLPKRKGGTSYLVPELLDNHADREDYGGGHDPGLMAAFQQGLDLGSRDDDPRDRAR
ncbi:ATP-binding protein [Saccharopolyspora taberi]|uniref:histidine kinase n=1 Tax=Saccharopolyspora taberi TaxID=60895 RepID=A0ABN3VAT7_9PSEU